MGLAIDMQDVVVRRGERLLLDRVTWQVQADQRWIVLGPNGAGKTTLLLIAAGRLFPTAGVVELLGERLGACDLAEVRPVIGWASSALAPELPPAESVRNAVLTGAYAVTGRWREAYAGVDERRCEGLLAQWGLTALAGRTFGTLSEGERKRTLIARALMPNPELLLLDEPGAGLDLAGREDLVARLAVLAADPKAPAQVVITHHVEEIPPGYGHALLVRGGAVVAQGEIGSVLTDDHLSTAFDMPLAVARADGRWIARRAGR